MFCHAYCIWIMEWNTNTDYKLYFMITDYGPKMCVRRFQGNCLVCDPAGIVGRTTLVRLGLVK